MDYIHLEIDFILVFLALMKWNKKTSKKKKILKMGPPKNTRFVFFTNNREEPKGNTLDCNVYFSLSGHNEAKDITKSHFDFKNADLLYCTYLLFHIHKKFQFFHSSIKEKLIFF